MMKKKNLKVLATASLIALMGVSAVACNQNPGSPDDPASSSEVKVNYELIIDQEKPSVVQGKTIQLTATVSPAQTPVSWSSSNEAIATVDEMGLVTGMSVGSCKIRASVGTGASALIKEVPLTVTDPDATTAGKVVIDYDNLPTEFAAGLENALDLDKYVKVTRVNRWSVVTESENIVIDGHKIIGLECGDFKATIVAGTTKRAITGTVVSESKLQFNSFIGGLKNNYEVYSTWTGLSLVAENYYAGLYGQNSETKKYVFKGSMDAADGHSYGFSIEGDLTDEEGIVFGSSVTVEPGYSGSKEAEGFTDFALAPSDFQEIIYNGTPAKGVTSDGETYYLYAVTADDSASSDEETVLDKLYDSLGQTNFWYFLSSKCKATYACVVYFPESGGINIIPANEKGLISSFTSGAQNYSTTVMLDSVNQISIPAVESWLKNPVIPEQIDVSPIQSFWDNLYERKSATIDGFGRWVDGDKKAIDCPSNMYFSDTKKALFGSFTMQVNANENILETTILTMQEDYQYANDAESGNFSTGTAHLTLNDNGIQKSAEGTYDAETGAHAYGEASGTESLEGSLWDSVFLGGAFKKNSLTIDNAGTKSSLLAITSFKEKVINDNGSVSYYFNDYGFDQAFGMQDGYAVGTRSMASMLLNMPGYFTTLWINLQKWGTEVTNSFTLSSDASSLDALFVFQVSSNAFYEWGWTISKVGEDNVSAEAKALLTPASAE